MITARRPAPALPCAAPPRAPAPDRDPQRGSPARVVALGLLACAVSVGAVVVLRAEVPAVNTAWRRASAHGPWWILVLAACEVVSFGGYIVMLHAVLGGGRIDRPTAALTAMAGVAASRLLAAGGIGGIALTGWVLRRSGRSAHRATVELMTFLLVLYGVYLAAIAAAAAAIATSALPGTAPGSLLVGAFVLAGGAPVLLGLTALIGRGPADHGVRARHPHAARATAAVPEALMAGRAALTTPLAPAGAVTSWSFDVATLAIALWLSGATVPLAVLVLAYGMGLVGNLLPIPGGVGGVEGGLVGTLIACGVGAGPALAGVLTYRMFSLWLPAIIGAGAHALLVARVRTWPAGGRP